MKNLVKKSAVALAVASSLMVSGVASADSLLAPLVIGLNNGPQTYFSIKVRGNGAVNSRFASASVSDLHYVWFKKGTNLRHLADLNRTCTVSNNNGRVSPWDMVFQRAVGSAAVGADGTTNMDLRGIVDQSTPNGYTAGDFVGFATISDKANVNANPSVKDLANEGEMSGFGYIVDASNSFVLDYKLLNNHRSKVEGDFSAGFISKQSVDFSWMPVNMSTTEWVTVVTGNDMLKADSGSGVYDATVLFSQQTASGSVSPQIPTGGSGVYDNDEKVTSGGVEFKVTCMGAFGRGTIMDELQLSDTINGGWKRMSIQNSATRNTATGSAATVQVASGAITYKAEFINFRSTLSAGVAVPELFTTSDNIIGAPGDSDGSINPITIAGWSVFGTNEYDVNYASVLGGSNTLVTEVYDVGSATGSVVPSPFAGRAVLSFQIETSGHLSSTPESHPNRPY